MSLQAPSLPALALDLQEGEAVPAFEELVSEFKSMVFSISMHYLGDRGLAEDVAQEVFIRAHRHLGSFESRTHAARWLRKVAARLCIDQIRSRPRHFLDLASVAEPSAEEAWTDPLASERLKAMVGALPDKARMAIILRYQEDLDPLEIAGILEEPLATVKSRLARALSFLRAGFGRAGGNE